jgi:ABC-type uncharacterized transport system substrate-binding protein
VLVNPANTANTETTLRDVEPAARAVGLQVQVLNADTSHEIDAAFATIVRERPDALFSASSPYFTSRRRVEAMEKRFEAMLEAAKTVQPALANFYNGLSDEQKARFNSLGSTRPGA